MAFILVFLVALLVGQCLYTMLLGITWELGVGT